MKSRDVHVISRYQTSGGGGGIPAPAFNVETILTHSLNPFGLPVQWFDPGLNAYYDADDIPVTDEEGNLVTQ